MDEFIDPQERERLASLEELIQQREANIALARTTLALRDLIRSEGWTLLRQFWESRIEESRIALLNVDTAQERVALDAVRTWQLRERQWEELASFINGALEFEGAEEILLKEQLNAS